MRSVACALVLVGLLIADRAAADVEKAWMAARDHAGPKARFAIGVDVAAITKLPSFGRTWKALAAAHQDLGAGRQVVERACGFDPLTAIAGVVVIGDPLGRRLSGAAFIQTTLDRTKVSACLESVLKATQKGRKVAVKQTGIYTVLSSGRDSLQIAWAAPNVVVVALDPEEKRMLDAWINRKGFAASPLGAKMSDLDSVALANGAFAFDKPRKDWLPALHGHGNLMPFRGTEIIGVGALVTTDTTTSRALADDLNKELARDLARDAPPAVKKLLGVVKIVARGTAVSISGKLLEKEVADVILELFGREPKKKEKALPPPTKK